ncbi:hypothetical protein [Kiloniella sp. EL199]|uniref:hypothetical protein n=1 Tax=Kiloniella sp. EL199 TaxID=2107581 RepID=UPI000EA352C3|nr:hypothetical protein [Kiloniella sp. EL199]
MATSKFNQVACTKQRHSDTYLGITAAQVKASGQNPDILYTEPPPTKVRGFSVMSAFGAKLYIYPTEVGGFNQFVEIKARRVDIHRFLFTTDQLPKI